MLWLSLVCVMAAPAIHEGLSRRRDRSLSPCAAATTTGTDPAAFGRANACLACSTLRARTRNALPSAGIATLSTVGFF